MNEYDSIAGLQDDFHWNGDDDNDYVRTGLLRLQRQLLEVGEGQRGAFRGVDGRHESAVGSRGRPVQG